jgi:hypothetical protein
MKLQRSQALLLAVAAVGAYTGAAAVNGLLPGASSATSFGPENSLTRYLIKGDSGEGTPAVLVHLGTEPGVAAVAVSSSVPVIGVGTDPYVSS